jgi:DNA polymerase
MLTKKQEEMQRVVDQISRCYLCPMAFHRVNPVPYSGTIETNVALIGEGPGREEDESGEAFVGPAGRDMLPCMTAFGIQRNHIFIANILKCRTKQPFCAKDNADPTKDQVANCFPYLWQQMEIVKPKLVIVVGGTAVKWVLNIKTFTMGELIGKKAKLTEFGPYEVTWDCDYTVMYHPASALHNPTTKGKVVKNMRDTFHRAKGYL